MWKLTDFGITGPALSKGVTTLYSRGSSCYRAPELFKARAKFTTKVDIWGLGCILYECITGSKAFNADYVVASYSEDMISTISLPWYSPIWQSLLTATIRCLLRKDETHRPTAANIFDLLTSYKRILVPPLAQPIFNSAMHLSYDEWNKFQTSYPNDIQWLYELGQIYKVQGESSLANIIFEEMVELYLDLILRLHDSNTQRDSIGSVVTFNEDPDLIVTTRLFEKVLDYLPKSSLSWVCYEIASYLVTREKGNWERAILICERGLKESPNDIILVVLLSNLYVVNGHISKAITTEYQNIIKQNLELRLNDIRSTLLGFYDRVLTSNAGILNEISKLMDL